MSVEQYGINPAEAIGLISTGAILGGLAVRSYMNSIFHDKGHTQLMVPESHAEAMVDVFKANDFRPRRRIAQGDKSNPNIVQATVGKGETVLLKASDETLEKMGNPTCGKTFITKSPFEQAEAAVAIFERHGHQARIDSTVHEETGDPLYHVVVEGCSIALGWRPHAKNMPGPMPPRWKATDSL